MKTGARYFMAAALIPAMLLCAGMKGAEGPAGGQPRKTDAGKTQQEAFYITEITDEIFARIDGRSFRADCTVPRSDLRYLHVLHCGFDGQTHEGEMICNACIAQDLLEIFRALYEADYPVESVRLVDEFGADDERSMAADNSSCFNFRFISHTATVSLHGYGLAVDINPLYNPYIKTVNGRLHIEPANAGAYADRSRDFSHKIEEGDLCLRLFREHGFEWGGDWRRTRDYQHFEVPEETVRKLYPEG